MIQASREFKETKDRKAFLLTKARFYVKEIRPNLSHYEKPSFPMKPYELPDSDEELFDIIQHSKKPIANNYTQRAAVIFGLWRNNIFAIESKIESNINLLLHYLEALESVDNEKAQMYFHELKEFLEKEYQLDLRRIPHGDLEIRQVTSEHSRKNRLISDRLLFGETIYPKKAKTERNNWQSLGELVDDGFVFG